MGELMTEEPKDNKALVDILERLAKQQKISISSPEINAAFQGGFREGFLEGFQEGMMAMRYVNETSVRLIKTVLDESEKEIMNQITNPGDKTEKADQGNSRSLYG